MSDVQDNSALKWIKGELDSTIDSARRSLEGYVERDGGGEQIDDCIAKLHQIYGTLSMVQLFGAALLAEEMELVAGALRDAGSRKGDAAAEALMLGLVQLSAYLEKLEIGARDLPLYLLPTLNELRAVRDAPLFSEVALYAPELEQKLASDPVTGKASISLPALARRVRHPFHKGLLDLYRERDAVTGLKNIAKVFNLLEAGSGTDQVRRLFTVGKAVAATMGEGNIGTGVATKRLLGRIDEEIKRIIDDGEQVVAEAPNNGLLKSLLYYIACSEAGDNPLIAQLKVDFELENTPITQSELERERSRFTAPGQELVESLHAAISGDLTSIKDGLDLFIRDESADQDRLFSLVQPMHKLADTLGMVGQGGLRLRLKRQADRINEIKSAETSPSEQDLMLWPGISCS